MTATLAALLVALLLPLLLGAGILRALRIRYSDEPLAFGAWAYVAGTLGLGVFLYMWLWTGAPLDARLLAPIVATGAGALLVFGRRRGSPSLEPPGPQTKRSGWGWETIVFRLCLAVSIGATILRIVQADLLPIVSSDEAHLWALKAKLLFRSCGFGEELTRRAFDDMYMPHLDYPLLNPLLQVWVFSFPREITHVENRLPIQIFGIAILLVLAAALRRRVRPALAGGLVLLHVGFEETLVMNSTCYADLMVALGLALAVDAWLRFQEDGRQSWWKLATLGLAFLLFSKNEGMMYACALTLGALACAIPPRLRAVPSARALSWMALPAAIVAATWFVNARFGFENDLVRGLGEATAGSMDRPAWSERLTSVLDYLLREIVFDPSHGSLLYVVFLVLVVLHPRALWSTRMRGPTIALLSVLGGSVLVYLVTLHDLTWHLPSSAPRLLYQPLPALLVWLAAATGILFPWLRSPSTVSVSSTGQGRASSA